MTDQIKPPGWGVDELSRFIALAQNNELATFANKKEAYELLRNIDAIYQSVPENLINTKKMLPALLFLRAHSAYRAACRLSMSGEVAETFVMARSCMEYALYACHVNLKPDTGIIWSSRHDSVDARKKCRSEFLYRKVLASLTSKDPRLASIVDDLYETCIDFGGHPNEKAVFSSMKVTKTSAGFDLKQLYLIGNSLALNHGLLNSARAGLCALNILETVWPERFAILGINDKLKALRSILH